MVFKRNETEAIEQAFRRNSYMDIICNISRVIYFTYTKSFAVETRVYNVGPLGKRDKLLSVTLLWIFMLGFSENALYVAKALIPMWMEWVDFHLIYENDNYANLRCPSEFVYQRCEDLEFDVIWCGIHKIWYAYYTTRILMDWKIYDSFLSSSGLGRL